MTAQPKQANWREQWELFHDDSLFLFEEWIKPQTLEIFRGKTVVDCGCGGGQHIEFVAPLAAEVLGIDLNTTDVARTYVRRFPNVSLLEGDLAAVAPPKQYDIAYCIGVIQHTSDPDATFANIKTFVKPGGRLILWCYAKEGNFWNWAVLEPLKRAFLLKLPRKTLLALSWVLTAALSPVIYTVYLLPLRFLPYYYYFQNWRKLSFHRNQLNVFDKLNAPITNFITREQVEHWFNAAEFSEIHIDHYNAISWRASGVKK
jgi:SAM-dependent methyltransferase